jgi:hypothetical protein
MQDSSPPIEKRDGGSCKTLLPPLVLHEGLVQDQGLVLSGTRGVRAGPGGHMHMRPSYGLGAMEMEIRR